MKDLSFNNVADKTWTTIGTATNPFNGTIEGNGYKLIYSKTTNTYVNNGNDIRLVYLGENGSINNWDLSEGNFTDTCDLDLPIYDNRGDISTPFENDNHGGR